MDLSTLSQAIFQRASQQEVLFITKHLAVMIKAGITLTEALQVLSDQSQSRTLRTVLNRVKEDVENGKKLSQALAKHPQIFNPFYTTLIEVSEQSGTLDENLAFLAEQLAKSNALRKKVQSALLYPTLVIVSTLVMGGFISFYILPQLITFFESFNTALPLPTQILLWIAQGLKNYGVVGLITLAIGYALFLLALGQPQFKLAWHRIKLHIPVLGKFFQAAELALFSRNLGILLASGVPVVTSLETTAHTLSNAQYQRHVLALKSSLSKGSQIGAALKQSQFKEFPLLVSRMITVGEKTGKLDETMLYLADFYEDEIDSLAKNLSTLLEPILLLGIGLVVGFVAVAIISPIYELTSSLQR